MWIYGTDLTLCSAQCETHIIYTMNASIVSALYMALIYIFLNPPVVKQIALVQILINHTCDHSRNTQRIFNL